MKLIITRHGETIENKKGITQGHLPGHLNKLGIQQARRLAKRLKDEKIDFIYSSDLKRAADTAKIIRKYHKNTPIKFVKELRERYLGKYQGTKSGEYPYDLWKTETKANIVNRVKKFLDKTLHKHRNETVLFVGHGGSIRGLMCVIRNKPTNYFYEMKDINNTSITVATINENKKHKIHLFNCTKHL